MFTDLSKAETIKEVQLIKAGSVKQTEEKSCKIAHIFVTIGIRLDDKSYEGRDRHKSLLTELAAPLSNTTMAHHYNVTRTGELVNMPQIVADLASPLALSAVLIQEWDRDMYKKARYDIKASDLHADARGKAAFMEEGLSHVDGQTSLCYWPWKCTGKQLLDDVKERKSSKF